MAVKPFPIVLRLSAVFAFLPFGAAQGNQPGALDEGFEVEADQEVISLAAYDNDHFLASGWFSNIGETPRERVARIGIDGSVDESFDVGAGADSQVNAVSRDSEGRVVVSGDFSSFDQESRTRVARLLENGSLDDGFVPPAGAINLRSVAIGFLDGGRIILGGWFFNVGENQLTGVVALNQDGTLDGEFNADGSGTNDFVHTMAIVEVDGEQGLEERILVGGEFTQYNGTNRNRIALLNPDGTLSENGDGFSVGTGFNGRVWALSKGAEGRIYAGGAFTSYRSTTGEPGTRIVRMLPNGDRDDSFNPPDVNNTIFAIAEDAQGRVVIGGDFTEVGGEPRNHIARLMPNGELDASFDPGEGADDRVNDLLIQNDESILLAGRFSSYDGVPRSHLARIFGGDPDASEGDYNEWRVEHFGGDASNDAISGPGADPDGDGIINLHEYAFGGDPNVRNTATLPAIGVVPDNGEFFQEITFHFFDANDLVYRVQVSDNLGNWTDLEEFTGTGSKSVSMETVRDPVPVESGQGRFLRVLVSLTEPVGVEPSGEFDAWRTDVFGADANNDAISGPLVDPDGDGVANLLEYAFNGDPLTPSSAVMPVQTTTEVGGETFMEITFHRRDVDDLVYRVQASDNLTESEAWEEIWVSTENAFSGDSQTVTDTVPVSPNNSRFLRVQVTLE